MAYRGRGGYRGDYGFLGGLTGIGGTGVEDFFPQEFPGSATDESAGLDMSNPFGSFNVPEGPTDIGGGTGGSGSELAPWLGGGIDVLKGLLGGAAGAAGPGVGSAIGKGMAKKLRKWIGPRMGSRRRMNPGNFKALRRSMRRLTAFEHAARKVIHFTHPKPTARVKFRFKRRRRR